mgnify:FL=1
MCACVEKEKNESICCLFLFITISPRSRLQLSSLCGEVRRSSLFSASVCSHLYGTSAHVLWFVLCAGHTLKNHTTNMYKAAVRIGRTRSRIIVTGTPVQVRPGSACCVLSPLPLLPPPPPPLPSLSWDCCHFIYSSSIVSIIYNLHYYCHCRCNCHCILAVVFIQNKMEEFWCLLNLVRRQSRLLCVGLSHIHCLVEEMLFVSCSPSICNFFLQSYL